MRPKARHADLLTEPVGDEMVLYDRRTHQAHRLSPVAGEVWRRCDGSKTVEELMTGLRSELDLPAGDADPVGQALDELARANLLEAGSYVGQRRFDRRAALVAAAALVPMVSTIVAPTPAHAQSTGFPPPPPPPPANPFEQYNGIFEGEQVLIDSGGFDGFSDVLPATLENAVDDQGEGITGVQTLPVTDYDLGARTYEVVINPDGTITGGGEFVTDQGVQVTCEIEGSFNADGTSVVFSEIVTFDNHIGVVTWEINASR